MFLELCFLSGPTQLLPHQSPYTDPYYHYPNERILRNNESGSFETYPPTNITQVRNSNDSQVPITAANHRPWNPQSDTMPPVKPPNYSVPSVESNRGNTFLLPCPYCRHPIEMERNDAKKCCESFDKMCSCCSRLCCLCGPSSDLCDMCQCIACCCATAQVSH
jgi:hypothetical protein